MENSMKTWSHFILIFIIILLLLFIGYTYTTVLNETTTCPGPGAGQGRGPSQNLMLFFIIIIVMIVFFFMIYYLTARNFRRQLDENQKLISNIVKSTHKETKEKTKSHDECKVILLRFLNYNENKVMKKLIEKDGTLLQSEISRMPNMGKVKTHRVIKDLEIKGVIQVTKYGKTNQISLSDDVKKVLLT
jgi:uncharacterized membrane protein